MNIARWKLAMSIAYISLLSLIFSVFSGNAIANALTVEPVVYNNNILYISKYINLVNIKDIIYIDIINNNKISNKVKSSKTLYLINDLHTRSKFLMPSYSVMLNLKSRVDQRVIISRLANALKSQETGGVGAYFRKSYSSSACGAYQYMPDTWNNFMGYKTACKAPEWVQDARITGELKASYEKYHDWRKVVAAHLSPARAGDMKTWNKPVPGNPTVSQYVKSVFNKANIVYA